MLETPNSLLTVVAHRAKARRLVLNLTQEGLSKRSGVSLASLKRFERTGQISFESLLYLALVLEDLPAFEGLFLHSSALPASLDELMQDAPRRLRGRKK